MLKKIENQINICKAVASSIIGTISGFLLKKFLFEKPETDYITLLIIAIIVFFLTAIANYLITSFIEKNKFLRKKILGNDFIEGHWIQKIESESYGLMHTVQYSLIKISIEKSHYKVVGTSFQTDGSETTAHFFSQTSDFNGVILSYPFTVESLEYKDSKNIFGHTKLHFSKTGGLPDSYFGIVESNVREKPVKVRGKKISAKENVDVSTKSGRERLITYI